MIGYIFSLPIKYIIIHLTSFVKTCELLLIDEFNYLDEIKRLLK